MNAKALLLPVFAAFTLTATSFADHKVTVYRDNDHDGHYNKKTYEYGHHYDHGRYYGHRYYGGYGAGYGYGYPYRYGYEPYYYGYPSVGVSIYSRPSYYSSRVYRGYTTGDSLAADVQRELRQKGYYGGPIDGAIGDGSRAAIRSYQREHGLPVTGRIDTALVHSLRLR
jgi:hypothetical protein